MVLSGIILQVVSMDDKQIVAIGTYGPEETHNLRLIEISGHGAGIRQTSAVSAGINPSYACPSADGRWLYVVNEKNRKSHGSYGVIKTYAIDDETYSLTYVSEIETRGDDPCYMAETLDRNFLIAVNYGSGSVIVIAKDENGVLQDIIHKTLLMGFGPNRKRQQGAHPHWVTFSPDGDYVYITDLGSDRIWIFTMTFDGKLRAADIPAVLMPPGSGPRALVFDSEKGIAFSLNELSSTITPFRYEKETGMLHSHKAISTLPEGFRGHNTASEIHLHDQTIVASNRGHNSLVFIQYEDTGFKNDPVWVESGGKIPRSFSICSDSDGSSAYIVAANRNSDSIVIFDMVPMGVWPVRELKITAPSCVRLVRTIAGIKAEDGEQSQPADEIT